MVEDVGAGVQSVRPGDRVATAFIPACGSCRWCVSGMTYVCDAGAMLFSKEMTTDGTARRHLGDADLIAMTQLGTFSEYMVVAEESVIKIDDSIPFEVGSLVSCGVTTGWGSGTVAVGNATRRHGRRDRHRRRGDQRRTGCPRRRRERGDRGGSC